MVLVQFIGYSIPSSLACDGGTFSEVLSELLTIFKVGIPTVGLSASQRRHENDDAFLLERVILRLKIPLYPKAFSALRQPNHKDIDQQLTLIPLVLSKMI